MTEVWKSQGRKFCEICKVWFGDNRASIEHHERGKKHKEALQMKLRELGKKSEQKEKLESRMNSTLAFMEKAAMDSMKEHGEGVEHGPALPATGLLPAASKIFDPKQFKDIGSMAREMAKRKEELGKQKRPGETRSIKQEPASKVPKKEAPSGIDHIPVKPDPEPSPSLDSPGLWVEATADYGRSVYYWNTVTGVTTWDRPPSFYTAAEYDAYCAQLAAGQPAGQLPVHSQQMAGGSRGNQPVEPKKEAEEAIAGAGTEKSREKPSSEPAEIAPSAEIASCLPDSIPLPEESKSAKEGKDSHKADDVTSSIKIEPTEPVVPAEQAVEEPSLTTSEPTTSVEVPVKEEEIEEKEEEEEEEKPSVGPFGGWKRVKKTDRAPAESPLTAKYRAEAELERKEAEEREKLKARFEKKYEFQEKVVPVKTKKVKGPIEFKKRTGSKNIRKPIE